MQRPATAAPAEACFLGQFECTVDTQRRVALPAAWRGDAAHTGFFLLPGRQHSLQLVPAPAFEALLQQLRKVSFADARSAVALATIGSMAQRVNPDRQGRFAMNPPLVRHAKLGDKALLLGAVTTIQIWDPVAWDAQRVDSDVGLDALQAIQERPDDFSEALRRLVRS